MRVSDHEPKPRIRGKGARMASGALSRQRSAQRRAEAPQVKMVLGLAAKRYAERVAERQGMPLNATVERIILDHQEAERRAHDLGFRNLGEALAVLKDRRGR